MSRRCLENAMKSEFYINLGTLVVIIYVDTIYYELAYKQILHSRYGQALTYQFKKMEDAVQTYYFEWDLEHLAKGWKVTVNKSDKYYINNLAMLGVHYNNQSDEISDCFEKVLFDHYIGYHASMVANHQGDVIMICGRVGSGKTTLTRAFIDIGYNYISDDLALIDENLVCQYLRTSFHIRTTQSPETHEINHEHRKFEIVSKQPMLLFALKLKSIIILNSLLDAKREVKVISNIYEKFKSINSLIIGFPSCDYVFTAAKKMLSLPFYLIGLSKNEAPKEAARSIGDLIWQKNT